MTDDAAGHPAPESQIRALAHDVADLVKRLEGSTVSRLLIETEDAKIEIERGLATTSAVPMVAVSAAPAGAAPAAEADGRHPIMAPLVGTFYRSAQPGAKVFVETGDTVDKGQTVAIVEAMKIMNQIQADRPGVVGEFQVKDGDWVEFQQVLLYLEPIDV